MILKEVEQKRWMKTSQNTDDEESDILRWVEREREREREREKGR